MKKFLVVLSLIVFCLASVSVVYALSGNKTITVTYRNITIYVNGAKKTSSDEPFIYNGKTYVPLRFISEALDKDVNWDSKNNRIDINDKKTSTGEWKKVIEFTGGDSVKTKPFTIHSKTWKIVYTAKVTSIGSGVFGIFAYKVGEDTYTDSIMASFQNGKASNESYIYEGNGDFYLDINAANCTYDIIVYEQ